MLREGINLIFREKGIDRLVWQIMHTLSGQGVASPEQLWQLLGAFVSQNQIEQCLKALQGKGWLQFSENGGWCLTEAGRAAHALFFQKQTPFREKAMQNITEAQYV